MATDIKNDATLSTNLVSCWELQEESGSRIDSHGDNDLTDNNTVLFGTGKVLANAADLEDDQDEYLNIAKHTDDLFTTSDRSMAMWLKAESNPGERVIESWYNDAGNQRAWLMIYEAG